MHSERYFHRCNQSFNGLDPNNRSAFTLIEVMIASMLISLVGLSLLQMHQNSADMSYNMQKKFKNSDRVLISAFETKLQKAEKRSYFETLLKPFNIDERGIREGLKEKVSIKADLLERINMSDITNELEGDDGQTLPSFEGLRLEVYQQHTSFADETYSVYRVIRQ